MQRNRIDKGVTDFQRGLGVFTELGADTGSNRTEFGVQVLCFSANSEKKNIIVFIMLKCEVLCGLCHLETLRLLLST